MNLAQSKRYRAGPFAACCLVLAFIAGQAVAGQYESRSFTEAEKTVSRSYIAYYGRAADPGGLAYWAGRLDSESGNLNSIIQAFGESQEFNDRFGDLGTVQLISNIYQQLFNRTPERAGLEYYQGELEAGRKSLQTIALDVLYGATGDDESVITNKLAVSEYFTSAMEGATDEVIDAVDADAMAELVAEVSVNASSLPAMFCRTRGVIFGVPAGMLDGQSLAQRAFVDGRGYPQIFTLSFTTEEVDDNGQVIPLEIPTRVESWVYNRGSFTSSVFENGYFVNETSYGLGVSLLATPYSPDQFSLCSDENDIKELMGEPSCVENHELAGRNYQLLRYDPTEDSPAASVALEDGLFLAITAGYGLTDSNESNISLCE